MIKGDRFLFAPRQKKRRINEGCRGSDLTPSHYEFGLRASLEGLSKKDRQSDVVEQIRLLGILISHELLSIEPFISGSQLSVSAHPH